MERDRSSEAHRTETPGNRAHRCLAIFTAVCEKSDASTRSQTVASFLRQRTNGACRLEGIAVTANQSADNGVS